MFPTVETRWFYRGAIPPAVADWYHSGYAPEVQPTRTDNYLQPDPPGSTGIKLREGRLEIKQRVRQYGVTCFHERACGEVEHWQKSSFEAETGPGALMALVRPGATWIAVQKARELRRYRVLDAPTGEAATVEAMAVVDYAERGCSIELAEIEVHSEPWWSLAFEAFGPENTLLENLIAVAQHAFAAGTVPAMEASHSFGYAYWLTILDF